MIAGWQQIIDSIKAVQSGSLDEITKVEEKYALGITEAEEDGRTLIDRHGCTSNQVKQLKSNTFQIVRERSSHGPADREP